MAKEGFVVGLEDPKAIDVPPSIEDNEMAESHLEPRFESPSIGLVPGVSGDHSSILSPCTLKRGFIAQGRMGFPGTSLLYSVLAICTLLSLRTMAVIGAAG